MSVERVLAAEPGAAATAVAADDGRRLKLALRLVERRMIFLKTKQSVWISLWILSKNKTKGLLVLTKQ